MKISEPIAIVGIGGVFPKALTVREFWKNILERVDCIEDITTRDYLNYWRVGDYLDPEPLINNKTYARKAGFLPEIEFDAMRFGIPPKSLEALSTAQLYALYVADQTLADARLSIEETTPEQRARTSVILGVGGMGNTGAQIAQRATVPDWTRVLRQLELPEEAVQAIIGELTALYADWQESTFPGFLSNIVAGRIASRFDFGGSNFTVDAACAATLAAVKVSIGELLDGSCDAVLTGGVNVENSIVSFLAFSRIGALSRREECHPFGVKADGLVLGDCCGMFVLKRLSDAERDGDRIYALIRGIGSSSDGRAKSIYAPRFEGQVWAVERAYADSGISPGEISYVEAHGTGTPVGDPVEIQSLSAVFDRCAISRRSIALSSVKSQIGHARIAAGAASIIKVALALQHKVLPPMTHADSPIPQLEDSAFYLNPTSRPWIRRGKSTRKAALSALGFGGTNFHVLMEEYDGKNKPYRLGPAPISLFFHAPTREALIQEARRLYAEVTPAEGENVIRAYVADINRQQTPPDHPRLACVGPDLTAVRDSLSNAIEYLSSRANVDEWEGPRGTYFRTRSLELAGKTVALFPGQGAQHPNMGLELALNFPEFQEVLSLFDRERERQGLSAISDLVYPVSVSSQEQIALQRAALTATVDAQPALGAVSWGMYLLLSQAGLKSDFAVGHSYGELPALCCGGAFGQQDLIRLSVARGRLMSQRHASGVGDAGKMLAVKAPSSEVVRILGEAGHKGLYVTNQNSTKQTVVGGSSELVDQFQRELQSCGIASIPIAVSGAFHTPYFEAARTEFQEEIGKTAFQQLRLPVLSNVTGQPFVESSSTNQSLLGQQMVMPVLFRQCIERVFDEGGRLFVEIGPGSILSDFVRDILAGREYFSVALHPKIGVPADLQYWNALAKLKVLGLPVSIVDPNFLPSRAPRVVSGKSLKFTLDGGLYLCPETRRARERALNEPKALPQLSTNSLGVHVQAPNGDLATPTGPKPAVLPHITVSSMPTTPTRELSQLHGKFIECQSEFVRLVASTLDAYTAAAQRSNGHNSPDLAFTSYQETLAMLDKAQTAFHQTHREYLNHRNEIERLIDPKPPTRRADLKDPAPVMTVRQQIRADWGGNGDPSTAAQTTRIELSAAHHTAPVQPETRLSSESVRKLDRETIATKLVQVVSETTGFPNESINLAMDLESDLGIDSIMKIEILAGVREAFPEIKLDQLDTSMQIRTLDEIVEALSSLVQQPQEGIVAPTAPTSFCISRSGRGF